MVERMPRLKQYFRVEPKYRTITRAAGPETRPKMEINLRRKVGEGVLFTPFLYVKNMPGGYVAPRPNE
jgi:hypothetical protein